MSTQSSADSSAIHLGAFLRTLIAPLIMWGVAVFAITAAGQPGVVCMTPMAWLLALWSGGQYVRLSGGRPGSLGSALVGLHWGWAWASSSCSSARKRCLSTRLGDMVVGAALSVFTARATLRRYTRDQ
jgi:hypothetical protein